MTLGGWITMTLSLVTVWGAALWCFSRVLRGGQGTRSAGDDRGRARALHEDAS